MILAALLGAVIGILWVEFREMMRRRARSRLEAEWRRQSDEYRRRRGEFCKRTGAWYDAQRNLYRLESGEYIPPDEIPNLADGLEWIGQMGNYPKHLQ